MITLSARVNKFNPSLIQKPRSGSTLTCEGNQHTNLTTQCLPEAAEDWMNVTLAEFTACNHNLALNRQTRMIADLTKIECYKHLGNLTHVPHDIERYSHFLYGFLTVINYQKNA